MNKKKRKKHGMSYGIVVDMDGEIITDFTDDEETLEAPYIKPKIKKKDEKDKPN
jgi:hypothetical protein